MTLFDLSPGNVVHSDVANTAAFVSDKQSELMVPRLPIQRLNLEDINVKPF